MFGLVAGHPSAMEGQDGRFLHHPTLVRQADSLIGLVLKELTQGRGPPSFDAADLGALREFLAEFSLDDVPPGTTTGAAPLAGGPPPPRTVPTLPLPSRQPIPDPGAITRPGPPDPPIPPSLPTLTLQGQDVPLVFEYMPPAWRLEPQGWEVMEPQVIEVLVQALLTGDPDVREMAAAELGGLGTPATEAIPALVQALFDPVPAVRYEAAGALPRVGPLGPMEDRVLAGLRTLLNDPDIRVREAARSSLDALGHSVPEPGVNHVR